jgi:hypothetical protein
MATHECDQVERLERIEADILNHRAWRTATTTQLTNIEIMMATVNERMKHLCSTSDMATMTTRVANLESHAEKKSGFRAAIVLTAIGLVASIITAVYAYGGLSKQVDVNTLRWEKIMQTKAHEDIK